MQEYNFIVEDIDKLIKSNSMSKDENNEADLSQIAIISKKRADLSIFAELLKIKIFHTKLMKEKYIHHSCFNFNLFLPQNSRQSHFKLRQIVWNFAIITF
ncbi:MAG: hypothetical protein L6V95_08820 [Candidatus Melainabacteria bacterium]|nr:MAG: hypothetical protein L6V95_08820 [Candidatus Melainabacteria bacterium]